MLTVQFQSLLSQGISLLLQIQNLPFCNPFSQFQSLLSQGISLLFAREP